MVSCNAMLHVGDDRFLSDFCWVITVSVGGRICCGCGGDANGAPRRLLRSRRRGRSTIKTWSSIEAFFLLLLSPSEFVRRRLLLFCSALRAGAVDASLHVRIVSFGESIGRILVEDFCFFFGETMTAVSDSSDDLTAASFTCVLAAAATRFAYRSSRSRFCASLRCCRASVPRIR